MAFSGSINLHGALSEDVTALVNRLYFSSMKIKLEGEFLMIIGSHESVISAQQYADRLFHPICMRFKQLSSYARTLFIPQVIILFENQFQVCITCQFNGLLIIRGEESNAEKCQTAVSNIDVKSCTSTDLVLSRFKINILTNLCEKYSIPVTDILTCNIHILLAFINFLSALDGKAEHDEAVQIVEAKEIEEPKILSPKKQVTFSHSPQKSYNVRVCRRNTYTSTTAQRSTSRSRARSVPRALSAINTARLRPIYIDAPDVALHHGNMKELSFRGIELAINFFVNRGHREVIAFLPRTLHHMEYIRFCQLERMGHLRFTPAHVKNGKEIASMIDRIMFEAAKNTGAVVVSNKNFDALSRACPMLSQVIKSRSLPYTIIPDSFIVPDDPFGRLGPSLDQILKLPQNSNQI
ncbi:NEDD4 binding protein 1 [Cichlidogyrus casuarinus]|uniref:NEDD4 binding protein 1 n=1 Tax=Cichlidogyrus casuarinus TaxID=1844966 RepID=A0ABD2QDF9_9PLAT